MTSKKLFRGRGSFSFTKSMIRNEKNSYEVFVRKQCSSKCDLNALHKKLIWFERSGHNPRVTESAEFVDVVVNKVLAETYSSND